VYPHPDGVELNERSTPLEAHVRVDGEVRGCPVSGAQLVEQLSAFLVGRRPQLPRAPLCLSCKAEGHRCLPVTTGEPCLGPVTQTGCGALCPAHGRGCYGCFGPSESPRPDVLLGRLSAQERAQLDATRWLFGKEPP
jgi:coenzyme F420-reducing hydrogenase gamma subunit